MPLHPIDRTKYKYGLLTPIKPVERFFSSGRRAWYWLCRCDCGGEITVGATALATGATRSCGCLRIICAKNASQAALKVTVKHGESVKKTKLYGLWRGILTRCGTTRPATAVYYKDRGIVMCKEWHEDYLAFKSWALENGYQVGLQIDRINNDLGYSPENCRFVTPKQQAQNRRPAKPRRKQGGS